MWLDGACMYLRLSCIVTRWMLWLLSCSWVLTDIAGLNYDFLTINGTLSCVQYLFSSFSWSELFAGTKLSFMKLGASGLLTCIKFTIKWRSGIGVGLASRRDQITEMRNAAGESCVRNRGFWICSFYFLHQRVHQFIRLNCFNPFVSLSGIPFPEILLFGECVSFLIITRLSVPPFVVVLRLVFIVRIKFGGVPVQVVAARREAGNRGNRWTFNAMIPVRLRDFVSSPKGNCWKASNCNCCGTPCGKIKPLDAGSQRTGKIFWCGLLFKLFCAKNSFVSDSWQKQEKG